jgi:4-amino-4-deoxy-L-arabinose transferase-like glycosyltransferase
MAQQEPGSAAVTRPMTWVFAALALALSVFRFLDADEMEHLHSTWHVLNGALPYVDFFEHHHALLWYALAPLLALTGQSAGAVIVFRLVFFALTIAIALATYRLALECGPSKAVARLSVVLLLSMTTFVYVAIEIRPDVPQVLFGVLSALYFVRALRTHARRDAVVSGAAAALAFLFLQKAVLLLAFYPIVAAARGIRRDLAWRLGSSFAGAFVAACVPAAIFLAATGSFDDYLGTNWFLNAHVGAGRAPVSVLDPVIVRDFARNAVFWGLSAATAVAAARRRLESDYAVPAWLGLGLVALIFALNRVVDRYLVAAIPFLAVAAAAWLAPLLERKRIRGLRLAAVLAVACLVPAVAMGRSVFRSNRGQLAKIQFVLDRSQAGDPMCDELRDFNLFRPDMHYFWFMTGPAVHLYGPNAARRFPDYDACRLIATVKPLFVSDRSGRLARCGLAGRYRPTPFLHLAERIEK